jgi:hypothetical protein
VPYARGDDDNVPGGDGELDAARVGFAAEEEGCAAGGYGEDFVGCGVVVCCTYRSSLWERNSPIHSIPPLRGDDPHGREMGFYGCGSGAGEGAVVDEERLSREGGVGDVAEGGDEVG